MANAQASIGAVVADWSGAATAEHRGLWLAEWDSELDAVTSVGGLSRAAAGDRILQLAEANPDLVAGLDFSFSLPAWWLAANRITAAGELWGDTDRLEGWLAACEPPFWGRPGRRRPEPPTGPEWRATELAAPARPRSTFQIGGAGAVGTASLRGMPTLLRLQQAGLAVWPFDEWVTPAVVEVWPRLAMGRTVKSSETARAAVLAGLRRHVRPEVAAAATASPDAFDAVVAAIDLGRRRTTPRPLPSDPVATIEGWIDGVPLP